MIAEQCELLARLRAMVVAKDAGNAVLRAELDAERGLRRRLELLAAELERQLRMDSTDSGTPSSEERIGARERRRAGRRQESGRERRKGRRRGGHPGSGLDLGPEAVPRQQMGQVFEDLIRRFSGISGRPRANTTVRRTSPL